MTAHVTLRVPQPTYLPEGMPPMAMQTEAAFALFCCLRVGFRVWDSGFKARQA